VGIIDSNNVRRSKYVTFVAIIFVWEILFRYCQMGVWFMTCQDCDVLAIVIHPNPKSEQHMAERNEFYAGLEAAWPMPDNLPVKRLKADDLLLAPPRMGHGRASCRVCGYTFREGDQVVLCPCHPDEPRCRAAVHRDLLRQLHCWDMWKRRQDEFRKKGKGEICLGMS